MLSMLSRLNIIESSPPRSAEEITHTAQVTMKITLIISLVTIFVTLVRPMVSELPEIFTFLGVLNASIFLALWAAFKRGFWESYSPIILAVVINLILLPMVVISGGIDSQYTPVVTVLPFGLMLIGTFHSALGTIIFWSFAWIALYFWQPTNLDLSFSPWQEGKLASQVFWLIGSSAVAMAVSLQFENIKRRQQKSLLALAEHDSLTGVYNRRGMERVLSTELLLCDRTQQKLTVMIVDVDNFKLYNDINGHPAGDKILATVANTLSKNTRAGQDTITRFGGEEFVIILRDTDEQSAAIAAEKFRSQVEALNIPYEKDKPTPLTVTLGFYSTTGKGETQSHIINQADKALYHGKVNGRNQAINAEIIIA